MHEDREVLGVKPRRRKGREVKSGRGLKLTGDTVSEETTGWGIGMKVKGPGLCSHRFLVTRCGPTRMGT